MKTILVAEDNDSNYILMSYILKRNYLYLRAKNGQEACDMVDKGGIDLVLMDVDVTISCRSLLVASSALRSLSG